MNWKLDSNEFTSWKCSYQWNRQCQCVCSYPINISRKRASWNWKNRLLIRLRPKIKINNSMLWNIGKLVKKPPKRICSLQLQLRWIELFDSNFDSHICQHWQTCEPRDKYPHSQRRSYANSSYHPITIVGIFSAFFPVIR